jgi:hypothetical protein
LNAFNKNLGLTALALLAVTAAIAVFWPALNIWAGGAGVLLMALNAWAAVGVLRLRTGLEPVKLILLSMLTRLSLVLVVMLIVISAVNHGPTLYSFVFSAMAGYVVFQALEIHHVVRHPELLTR